MNWRSVWAVVVKDWLEVRQNRAAWIPAVVVPLVMMVVLPFVMVLMPRLGVPLAEPLRQLRDSGFVARLAAQLAGLNEAQSWVVLTTAYLFAPFFLIVPIMASTIVGADSFVGEKERKTLEALLFAPISDAELLAAKALSATLPGVGLAWAFFVPYAIIVNAVGWPIMHRVWFPTLAWAPLLLWITPALAVLGTLVTVLISSRVHTFMEAYQLSGALVVVVLALIVGQITGVLILGPLTAIAVGAVIWAADALLMRYAIRSFHRAELISRV